MLALKFLSSANVSRATIALNAFGEQSVVGRFFCARGLRLEGILRRIDNGNIFEKLTTASLLVINTLLSYVNAWLLQGRPLGADEAAI